MKLVAQAASDLFDNAQEAEVGTVPAPSPSDSQPSHETPELCFKLLWAFSNYADQHYQANGFEHLICLEDFDALWPDFQILGSTSATCLLCSNVFSKIGNYVGMIPNTSSCADEDLSGVAPT